MLWEDLPGFLTRGPADATPSLTGQAARDGTGRDDFRFYPSRSGPHVVISSPSGHIFIKIVSPTFAGRYHCCYDFEIQRSDEFGWLPRTELFVYELRAKSMFGRYFIGIVAKLNNSSAQSERVVAEWIRRRTSDSR